MKFAVSSAELYARLSSIGKVINAKNPIQILDSFLFDLKENTLKITASDVESTIITSIEVSDAEGEGKVAVQSKLLLDTLNKLSEQTISFAIDDNNLAMVINSDNGKYNFVGQSGEDYPEMTDSLVGAKTLAMSAQQLAAGIAKTAFAAAVEDVRPIMTGILFDIKPDSLVIVATDAHKLVKYKTVLATAPEVQEGELVNFILPPKPSSLLKNILAKEENAQIVFDNRFIEVTTTNYFLRCRQIEGKYPNYDAVIPKEYQYSIFIDRELLLNALRRVQLFANEGNNMVKFEFSENILHISAQDLDFSTSADEVINCNYSGAELKIGFKSPFLVDILANLSSKDVEMQLIDPARAGLILPVENEPNEEVVMLLMPMLLND
ncbi:MAG: DNA polymerase III subunit beta [Paludibacter sp.]|jgi:DNA polymerase-3 subunit beta|nr:DNA polymerase III subunit beta [Paludibacter sp.]